jgi:histidinol-phosphate aminotransferase
MDCRGLTRTNRESPPTKLVSAHAAGQLHRMKTPLTRRQWLLRGGATLAGAALTSRFLNFEAQAQMMTPERLAATAAVKARLSLNENPFGPSPAAMRAILDSLTAGKACRYPYGEASELVNLIAQKEGVPADHIVLGVGSGELLEKAGVHFGLLKGEAIYAAPGYLQLPRALEAAGGRAVAVPVNSKQEHDLPAMAAAITKPNSIVYIANPNNPTGTVVPTAALRDFVRNVSGRAFILLDEAYLDIADDYAGRTLVGLVRENPHLLVARTFSKIYGLAGLRIGYGITSPKFAAVLRTYGPASLGFPSVMAAIASLKDETYVATTRAKIVSEKEKLLALLRELGRPYADSQTNFVFFKTGRPHAEVHASLMKESVSIARAFPPMNDWARITIGLPEENEFAREALRRVLG